MTRVKAALCAIVAASSLAACSSQPSAEEVNVALKAATVSALPEADGEAIEVLNPQRSAATWRWNAKAGGKTYACDADNQMRLPSCKELT